MDFFDRQEASHRATRYLVALFGLAFLAVGLATGVVLLIVLGVSGGGAMFEASGSGPFSMLSSQGGVLALIVATIVGLMIVASLIRAATLSQGGGHVARMLGGTRIQGDDQDPNHRRLIHVVEEMAIASGLPVPEVYVLEAERGINAFAAGLSPADAAVAVTRGSLEQLNRAQLQGVIAHEFSHVLNGDMRLNLRLMGFSYGILILSLAGRWLLRASGRGIRMNVSRRKGGGAPIMIGIALTVIGGMGVVLSRLIKAAVSRQREVLADASAVQFTREPLALAGALKKIGGFTPYIEAADSEEVSHMLFGRAGRGFTGLFATHPPLPERIKALDPSFKPGAYIEPGVDVAAKPDDGAAAVSGLSGVEPQITIESAGTIVPAAGRALRTAIPTDVADAAHSSQSAWLLVLALGLARGGGTEAEKRLIENQIGADRAARCFELHRQIEALDPQLCLPLFEVAVPALQARPREEIEFLFELLQRLTEADGQVNLFEYLLKTMLRAHFYPSAHSRTSTRQRNEAMQTLIAVIATEGHTETTHAKAAFAAGLKTLNTDETADDNEAFARAVDAADFQALDSALTCLAGAPLREQRRALLALAATMRHDARTTLAEAELFRTIAATLGCPVPPADMMG